MLRTVGVVLAHYGVGHRAQGLLSLRNLMGDAGINDESKNIYYVVYIVVYSEIISGYFR